MSTVAAIETARMRRRAHRIAQLRHPNLVRMLPMPGGAGFAPTLTQGRRLAEFTQGGTFRRFELEQVVRLLLDVLAGLSALHEDVEDGLGFVHGEVSPAQIYVADDGTARLVPLLGRHWIPATPVCSNGYTAPEFLLSSPVDPRADVFSVGVMLAEALTGTTLFPEPNLDTVIARLLGGKLLPLLPTPENRWAMSLSAIAERALSPYPELRFRSAVELSNAIGAAVGPQLAERQDVWQAEAPTLAQGPRPGCKALRSITPLATVLDLESLPNSLPAPAMVPQPAHAEASLVVRPWLRRSHWAVALGAAAVAVLAFSLRRVPAHEFPPLAAAPTQLTASASVASACAPNTVAVSACGATPAASSAIGAVLPSAPQSAKRPSRPRTAKPPSPDYGF